MQKSGEIFNTLVNNLFIYAQKAQKVWIYRLISNEIINDPRKMIDMDGTGNKLSLCKYSEK